MSFDAYAAWLQISDDRRPPNHYDLLGLPTLEPDVERIRAAALQRIALVRKYQLGQHADDALRLLGELSRAFDTLTDAERKLAYDRQLSGQQTVAAPLVATVADAPIPAAKAGLPPGRPLEPPPPQPKPALLRPVVSSSPSPTADAPPPIVNRHEDGAPPAEKAKAAAPSVPRRRRGSRQNQSPAIIVGILAVAVLLVGGIVWFVSRTDAPPVAQAATPTQSKQSAATLPVPKPQPPAPLASGPPLAEPKTAEPTTPAPTTIVPPAETPPSNVTSATPVATATAPTASLNPPAAPPVTAIQPPATTIQPPLAPPQTGRAIDVLKLINANRDALKGSWLVDLKGNLHSPHNVTCAALELPVDPPEEYVLKVSSVRREHRPGTLVFGLVMQRSPFLVVIDGGGKIGLEMVDGRMFRNNETTHPGGVYPEGTRTDFTCTVLKSRVMVSVNGKRIIDWQGDPGRLKLFKDWPVRNRRRLFVGSHSHHLIVKAELAPINGATAPPSTSPSPDVAGLLPLREKNLMESLAAVGSAPPPSLAESMLNLVDSAVQAEEFELAARVAGNVPQVADELKDPTARKELRVRINDARKARANWEALAAAKTRLTDRPDDPAANTTYGRYLCLTLGNWSTGLPRLAKSDDAKLAALARDDLANPPQAKARLELGDGWWDQALSAAVPDKPQFKARAGHWYDIVLPGLSGPDKKRVEGRIAQVEPPKATPATAGRAPAARGLIARYRGQLKLACSSFTPGYEVKQLVDGDPNTSWYTVNGDSVSTGKSPWFTVEFPEDVTVIKVLIAGNRDGFKAQPFQVTSAFVELFDQGNKQLRKMTANAQGPAGDFEFNLKVPARGVRSLRFQSLNDRGAQNGLGEIALGEIEVE